MQKFTTLEGVAAPMKMINVDTDMIIPKQYLKTVKRTGLGKGLFSEKRYADDGERVTIVEFEHEEGMRAWRTNPEHLAAQRMARQKYYTEYHIQVCTLDRESKFKAQESAEEPAKSAAAARG